MDMRKEAHVLHTVLSRIENRMYCMLFAIPATGWWWGELTLEFANMLSGTKKEKKVRQRARGVISRGTVCDSRVLGEERKSWVVPIRRVGKNIYFSSSCKGCANNINNEFRISGKV